MPMAIMPSSPTTSVTAFVVASLPAPGVGKSVGVFGQWRPSTDVQRRRLGRATADPCPDRDVARRRDLRSFERKVDRERARRGDDPVRSIERGRGAGSEAARRYDQPRRSGGDQRRSARRAGECVDRQGGRMGPAAAVGRCPGHDRRQVAVQVIVHLGDGHEPPGQRRQADHRQARPQGRRRLAVHRLPMGPICRCPDRGGGRPREVADGDRGRARGRFGPDDPERVVRRESLPLEAGPGLGARRRSGREGDRLRVGEVGRGRRRPGPGRYRTGSPGRADGGSGRCRGGRSAGVTPRLGHGDRDADQDQDDGHGHDPVAAPTVGGRRAIKGSAVSHRRSGPGLVGSSCALDQGLSASVVRPPGFGAVALGSTPLSPRTPPRPAHRVPCPEVCPPT